MIAYVPTGALIGKIMFGIATDEKIPDAYLHDHAAWDDYIGHLWYNLLCFLGTPPTASVIEIAPGASIKIGSALRRLDFSGDLYIIDASPKVITALRPRYEALLPKARLHWIGNSLDDSYDQLPAQVDAILASHVVDDMLVYAANPAAATEWAAAYTHVPAKELSAAWRDIEGSSDILSAAKSTVRDSLGKVLKKLSARHVILNQYPSSTLYDNGMASLNDHACDILNKLRIDFKPSLVDQAQVQRVLGANKHYNNTHLGEHVLNAKYWMLCNNT